ncbi:DUF3341 domain-containing protein [Paracoccus sp. S-4012]|uniref:DUF3341 domain-containing protein n=1 Tax=Paracoccus sp. S-4012 TaxID=2665648 RepID=UPI0012B0E961|nr:DUF3341 domain-containing protein [Paracoccus sp. S-4012]MRX49922.1 DUF3341 domain-containing protein [Paracoccus sp. S-4012]
MSEARLLLAFDAPDDLIAAAWDLRRRGQGDMDAHVPFRIPELDEALDLPPAPVRPVMLAAALAGGAATFALQWWTSVRLYPFDSGGRPLNAWQVFTFAVFEIAVLSAAAAGLIAMFVACGLPRLHHPFFATARTERAGDDRFYLSLPDAPGTPDRLQLSAIPGLREIIEVAP